MSQPLATCGLRNTRNGMSLEKRPTGCDAATPSTLTAPPPHGPPRWRWLPPSSKTTTPLGRTCRCPWARGEAPSLHGPGIPADVLPRFCGLWIHPRCVVARDARCTCRQPTRSRPVRCCTSMHVPRTARCTPHVPISSRQTPTCPHPRWALRQSQVYSLSGLGEQKFNAAVTSPSWRCWMVCLV